MKTQSHNVRLLSIFSMIVSPMMLLYSLTGSNGEGPSSLVSILFGLFFQLGAMGCALALYRTRATGDGAIGKGIVLVQVFLHSMAALFQLLEYFQLEAQLGTLYLLIDLCWPLGFLFWFVTGGAVLWAGRWTGWQRFLPMLCPLPLLLGLPLMGVLGAELGGLIFSGGMSSVFFLLALTLFRQSDEPQKRSVLQPSF